MNTLHPHELNRLNTGEPTLLVRPVEPQPTIDGADFAALDNSDIPQWWLWRGPRDESAEPWEPLGPCPLGHPCDVVEVTEESGVCHCGIEVERHTGTIDHGAVDMPYTHSLRVLSVEVKQIDDVTDEEALAAGFTGFLALDPSETMFDVFCDHYPSIDWSNAWVWCVEVKLEGKDGDA